MRRSYRFAALVGVLLIACAIVIVMEGPSIRSHSTATATSTVLAVHTTDTPIPTPTSAVVVLSTPSVDVMSYASPNGFVVSIPADWYGQTPLVAGQAGIDLFVPGLAQDLSTVVEIEKHGTDPALCNPTNIQDASNFARKEDTQQGWAVDDKDTDLTTSQGYAAKKHNGISPNGLQQETVITWNAGCATWQLTAIYEPNTQVDAQRTIDAVLASFTLKGATI